MKLTVSATAITAISLEGIHQLQAAHQRERPQLIRQSGRRAGSTRDAPLGVLQRTAGEAAGVGRRAREGANAARTVGDRPLRRESPVEFLAVPVEAFFERPLALRRGHAEVHSMLLDSFGQGPAAWDDARGLVV